MAAIDFNNVVDLYIRVSTSEQAEEGYSVAEQEERLRSYCAAFNYIINAIHIDPGFSGASLDRPGIKKVMYDVEHGRCKKVIVWKLDRLSRSQKDTLILLEDVFLANDCNFISLMESFDTSTPFGRCIVGILAAFAQMERENIKIRTMMGRQARIRDGHFHGSRCPLGYKFQYASDGTLLSNDLVVDPYTSKLVQEVYRLSLGGSSFSSIAAHMASTYGCSLYDWSRNTAIRRILSNPIYMGKVKVGNELYPGIHEPLVSETDWYMVAAMLKHNKEQQKRTYAYQISCGVYADNLLTGLLFCGDCGARMYARRVSQNKKKYICHSVAKTSPAMIKSDHCTNRLHPFTVHQLDEMVIDEILKLSLDRPGFDMLCDQPDDSSKSEDKEIYEERLAEVNRQLDRLVKLYQTGLIDLDNISARLGDLNQEKNFLEGNLATINEITPADLRETAWKSIQSLQSVLDNGDMDEVHRIIHTLIDKVVVLNADVTIYWSFC